MDEENVGFEIPLVWIGAEDLPVLFVNQIVGQVEAEEHVFYLTVGQALPPALIGTQDERLRQLQGISYVSVKPIARLAFTRKKLEELVAVLQTNLDQYEQIIRQMEGGDET